MPHLLKYPKNTMQELGDKVYARTYLKGQPLAALVLLCLVPFLTILSIQIQLPSTDLHYPAKYFWHLTKILNIKVYPNKKNSISVSNCYTHQINFCIWLPYFGFKSQWIIGSGLHS